MYYLGIPIELIDSYASVIVFLGVIMLFVLLIYGLWCFIFWMYTEIKRKIRRYMFNRKYGINRRIK